MKIGAQFYTIRDFCQTPDDLAESLKRVADIGYTTVQISGTCAYDPAWLRDRLAETGLRCVITHTPADRMLQEPASVAKDHDVFDCKYIGIGWYDLAKNTAEEFAKTFLPTADVFAQNGKYLMYHNHHYEFRKVDGKPVLQLLSEVMPADRMGFTLDTYWAQTAGADPAQWLEKLSGRVPCIHLKDHAFDRNMAPVGEGNINFDRVFAAAEAAGTEYMLVEQDDCYGDDPFDCLARSYRNLRAFGLE